MVGIAVFSFCERGVQVMEVAAERVPARMSIPDSSDQLVMPPARNRSCVAARD
jgi:hypothetical protein